jgi:hypothetical protein
MRYVRVLLLASIAAGCGSRPSAQAPARWLGEAGHGGSGFASGGSGGSEDPGGSGAAGGDDQEALAFDPAEVAFAERPVGSDTCHEVRVINVGKAPAFVRDIRLDHDPVPEDLVLELGDLLDRPILPGDPLGIRLCFRPETAGRVLKGSLRLRTDRSVYGLPVTARARASCLRADPSVIDVGIDVYGTPRYGTTHISEVCGRPTQLEGVSTDAPGAMLDIEKGNLADGPLQLSVAFAALGADPLDASIEVVAGVPGERDRLVVPVRGRALRSEPCELDVPRKITISLIDPSAPVRIANVGASACWLWDFGLSGPDGFVLDGEPEEPLLLQAGKDLGMSISWQKSGKPDSGAVISYRSVGAEGMLKERVFVVFEGG